MRLAWNVPEALPDAQVPSLSIQPLAENAIRHGIEHLPEGGCVDVSVRIDPRHIEIIIGNDLPALAGCTEGHAVGLASARERVLAMTDRRGRVDAGVEKGRFVARVRLPLD